MAWQRRWLGVMLAGVGCWLTSGCMDLPKWAQPQSSPSSDISQAAMPTIRSQTAEGGGVKLQTPTPAIAPPAFAPPPQEKEIVQTSAMISRGTVRVSIRAWVNHRPIFDEEVRQGAGPALDALQKQPEPLRSEKMKEQMDSVLDHIIDKEVMYQDAVKRLKIASPTGLKKLEEFVDSEFRKNLKTMRDRGASEAYIRSVEPIARRMMERELVANEYARTLIKGEIDRVNLDDIREYYDEHKADFMTVDRIEWQDIFLPLNANLRTVEQAKHFAEDLVNKCRTPDEFTKLMVYDELAKHSGCMGLGNLRGQIQPPELEEALFKLRAGEIGPVIPLSTGVHLIRVTKREYAGQKPLDYPVQKTIRKKLQDERAERVYKRLVRELRDRATIRYE